MSNINKPDVAFADPSLRNYPPPAVPSSAVQPLQVSISQTFYKQLICTKELCKIFLYLQNSFAIFPQKNMGQ